MPLTPIRHGYVMSSIYGTSFPAFSLWKATATGWVAQLTHRLSLPRSLLRVLGQSCFYRHKIITIHCSTNKKSKLKKTPKNELNCTIAIIPCSRVRCSGKIYPAVKKLSPSRDFTVCIIIRCVYRAELILAWQIVYLSYKDPCPTISINKSEIKVH